MTEATLAAPEPTRQTPAQAPSAGSGWRERLARLARRLGLGPRPEPVFVEADEPRLQPWVVVDCETTGLQSRTDVLLSIAAVRMQGRSILASESFHQLLRPESVSSTTNVLVHGIAHDEQRSARPPAEVLAEFQAFVAGAPLVGFHAGFDARFLAAAFRRHTALDWHPLVIDCAVMAPVLLQDDGPAQPLDVWLQRMGIQPLARHDALSDAFCTAQLWQTLQAAGEARRCRSVSDWRQMQKNCRALERTRI